MAKVQIKLDQAGKPPGMAGVARQDLATGVKVVATAVGGPYASYRWELIDAPPDYVLGVPSACGLATPVAASTDVLPIDNPQTYKLRLSVDSGLGLGAGADDVADITFYAGPTLAFAPDDLPQRWPAFAEGLEHNVPLSPGLGLNSRGWAETLDRWRAVITKLYTTASAMLYGWSVGLYVDAVRGNDGTAVRGNSSKPYQHIQTALAAALSGDAVYISPGTYNETLALPELAALSVFGAGDNETFIVSASRGATIGAAPTTTNMQTLMLSGFTCINTNSHVAVCLSGASLGTKGIFISGTLIVDHVRIPSGHKFVLSCAGNAIFRNSIFGLLETNEVNNGKVHYCYVDGSASVKWDGADLPDGILGEHRVTFLGCNVSTLLPKTLAQVGFYAGYVETLTTSFTEDGFGGYGQFRGSGYLGTVTISSTSALGDVPAAIIDGSQCVALTVNNTTIDSVPGPMRVAVSARNANITSVTANEYCDVDIRNSAYTTIAAGGAMPDKGTVNRTWHKETFEAVLGSTDVPLTVPYPDTNYYPMFSMVAAGADPFAPLADRAKDDLKITCAAATGTGNTVILYHPG